MALGLIPTYFSSPNLSIPTPDANGPLHLGSVITDLKDPIPLNPNMRVPIPENVIVKSHVTGYSTTLRKSRELELGIFVRIFRLHASTIQPSINQGRSHDEELTVDLLETRYFDPSPEYIDECINLQPVKKFRNARRDQLPVFLVTGIKIARGASATIVRGRSMGGSFTGVGDGSSLAETGPSVERPWSTKQETSFTGSSDFVLAYRVTKVTWKKGEVRSKVYTSGATVV